LANPEHRFDAAALGLLQDALAASPEHPRARWFAGVAAFQRSDHAEAAELWQALLQSLPPDAEIVPALTERIAESRRLAGLPPLAAAAQASAHTAPESGNPPLIRLRVELDPSLQAKVSPGDRVFVFARAIDGPPMPLAVRRPTVADLPAEVMLGDADSMLPNMTLSSQPRVTVMARVSFGGQPGAQAGDLESAASDIVVGSAAAGVDTQTLRIDSIHP